MGSDLNNPASAGGRRGRIKGSNLNNPASSIVRIKKFLGSPPKIGIRQLLREMGLGFNKGGAVLKSRKKKCKYF